MKKYFKFQSTPVEFDGTTMALKKFKADNDHLEEVDKSEFDAMQTEQEKLIRLQKRAAEYPPIGDALDALAKWAFTENEIGLPEELKSWAAKCMNVKSKYPKGD